MLEKIELDKKISKKEYKEKMDQLQPHLSELQRKIYRIRNEYSSKFL